MKYWRECICEALDDAGLIATDDQVDIVTDWVEGAHENYGLATGHDCIPNPLHAEVDNLKSKIKLLNKEHEEQLYGIKKGVAIRRNVSINDVSIDETGSVTFRN